MNIDTRPIEFGMKEIAKSIRTQAQIHKEVQVGTHIVSLVQNGTNVEEATAIVNKAFAVRDHSGS